MMFTVNMQSSSSRMKEHFAEQKSACKQVVQCTLRVSTQDRRCHAVTLRIANYLQH